jgi:hypothetical protein
MILWSSFNTFPINGLLSFCLIKLSKTNRWTKNPNLTFFFLMIFLTIFLLLQQFNYTFHHFCSVFQCFCSQLSQISAINFSFFFFDWDCFFSLFIFCMEFVVVKKKQSQFYSIFHYNFYFECHILFLLYLCFYMELEVFYTSIQQ